MKNVAFWKLNSIYENVFKRTEVISNIKNTSTSFKQSLTFGIPLCKSHNSITHNLTKYINFPDDYVYVYLFVRFLSLFFLEVTQGK